MLPWIMVNNVGDLCCPKKWWSPEKKVITFLAVTCNATRDQHELIQMAAMPRNLFGFITVPTDKKVWDTL